MMKIAKCTRIVTKVGSRAGNPEGYVHFTHGIILFVYSVIYFLQRVILKQNFVSLTHFIKNKVQDEIWTI